ncbi:hypothetical protein RESH_04871 [Rhodopirellula europaea SH398]|uniref:Uncharacterized protein n=1 Tax=Rhodopirellula europaea SH398 TaxID=1263868 RepID=M5RYX7_9BACT|nr:hypothetical protein RESH_04871 [Rhodopirellula europaea SH398]
MFGFQAWSPIAFARSFQSVANVDAASEEWGLLLKEGGCLQSFEQLSFAHGTNFSDHKRACLRRFLEHHSDRANLARVKGDVGLSVPTAECDPDHTRCVCWHGRRRSTAAVTSSRSWIASRQNNLERFVARVEHVCFQRIKGVQTKRRVHEFEFNVRVPVAWWSSERQVTVGRMFDPDVLGCDLVVRGNVWSEQDLFASGRLGRRGGTVHAQYTRRSENENGRPNWQTETELAIEHFRLEGNRGGKCRDSATSAGNHIPSESKTKMHQTQPKCRVVFSYND